MRLLPFALSAAVFCLPLFTVPAKLSAAPRKDAPVITDGKAVAWKDLSNRAYGVSDLAKAKATVFIFTSMECPIAVRYAPRLQRMGAEYAAKGVSFFLVNANTADDAASLAKWGKERKITLPLVKDEGTTLADWLGVSATPEAAVVTPDGKVVYRGRIDDSIDEAKVSRHDLADALDDVLAGRSVRRSRVLPFGCAIFRDKAAGKSVVKSPYTWARDIAPILDQNCVVCHRSGDVGPFALDTYAQAKLWSSAIKDYTARRVMPPWKAQPGHGEFWDSRYLTDEQIKKLAVWADGGTPEGNVKDQHPVSQPYAAGEWALGAPDIVLKPVKPYRLEAEGADVYRDFTLPADFNEDRYISAFDFRPGNRTIVHHMIAYIDVDGKSAVAQDNKDTEPGWSVSGGGSGIQNDDWGDGWAPGMNPRRLPEGVAVKIPKGAKLVLQVHYHKSGKPETDQSEVAIYWAKEPVKQVRHTWPLGTHRFALVPDVAGQEVKAEMTVPFSLTLREILPHMHMLGKEMKVWATLPDGTERDLIYIKDWDFNWQMNYRYKEPVRLPQGTKLHLVAQYDNTVNNPRQPSNPPRRVTFGEQTTDEMCYAFLGFTTDSGR